MRAQNIFDIALFDSGLTDTIINSLSKPLMPKDSIKPAKARIIGNALASYPAYFHSRATKTILLTT